MDIGATLTTREAGIVLRRLNTISRLTDDRRNKDLCRMFTERGYQGLTEARVRKCINYIRINGLVPHLIANSHGYFCATSIEQVETYIESLDQRAKAIWAMRAALNRELSGKLFI